MINNRENLHFTYIK